MGAVEQQSARRVSARFGSMGKAPVTAALPMAFHMVTARAYKATDRRVFWFVCPLGETRRFVHGRSSRSSFCLVWLRGEDMADPATIEFIKNVLEDPVDRLLLIRVCRAQPELLLR